MEWHEIIQFPHWICVIKEFRVSSVNANVRDFLIFFVAPPPLAPLRYRIYLGWHLLLVLFYWPILISDKNFEIYLSLMLQILLVWHLLWDWVIILHLYDLCKSGSCSPGPWESGTVEVTVTDSVTVTPTLPGDTDWQRTDWSDS